MKGIHYEKCPPQHVIYGPSAPIAPNLTPENWQEFAIFRAKQYVYIARGYRSGEEEKNWRYFVDVSPNPDLKADFEELDDAIEYANSLGEKGKELPFKRSSGVYASVKFGEVRESVEILPKKA
jgi:hypothetical protein